MPSRAAIRNEPAAAEIVREYGPFPGATDVAGVTFDGESAWFAAGDHIQSFDPKTGVAGRALLVAADAGTAFDGKHLFQIANGSIQKIDPENGRVLSTLPIPGGVASGLVWAEGALWVGRYRERKIDQIDPDTGSVLRSIQSDRFVTGVTFVDDELWHGTWENDASELRRVDIDSGEVLERLLLPAGIMVSGLEAAGTGAAEDTDAFLCGGGRSGKIRAVRRPR